MTRRVVVIRARSCIGLHGLAYGIDDARLRAAPANVALQELRDFAGTRIGITLQQAHAAHDHSRSAIGALKRAGVDEGLLHRM